jgi:bifunctional non-homologous end joining protein LigD
VIDAVLEERADEEEKGSSKKDLRATERDELYRTLKRVSRRRWAGPAQGHGSAQNIALCAFDVLHLNGRDLMRLPLEERRGVLGRGKRSDASIRPSSWYAGADRGGCTRPRPRGGGRQATGLAVRVRQTQHAWVKVKFNRRQEFVIGGFKPNDRSFESLLVGYYERDHLLFAGKVRAGLTPHTRTDILGRLVSDHTAACPFANLPTSKKSHWGEGVTPDEMSILEWVKPNVVVEVSFVEWPLGGLLRHSEFVGPTAG